GGSLPDMSEPEVLLQQMQKVGESEELVKIQGLKRRLLRANNGLSGAGRFLTRRGRAGGFACQGGAQPRLCVCSPDLPARAFRWPELRYPRMLAGRRNRLPYLSACPAEFVFLQVRRMRLPHLSS